MLEVAPDSPLRQATLEVEEHVAQGGWDQPPRLFALVRTAQLLAAQPGLELGDPDGYTPVEQDGLPPGQSIEDVLPTIMWPDAVDGCVVAMERIMLPPSAEGELPEDPEQLQRVVADHPQRQDVRIVAGVLRDGTAHSTVRARAGEDPALLEGPDLVPALSELLRASMS